MHCGICNYTEDKGSDLLDKPPNELTTVRWNKKYGGFICSDCVDTINYQLAEYIWKDEDIEEKEMA